MSNLYMLQRKSDTYYELRRRIGRIYEYIGDSRLINGIPSVTRVVKKNISINDDNKYVKELENINTKLWKDINNLYDIINHVNRKIESINNEISECEDE